MRAVFLEPQILCHLSEGALLPIMDERAHHLIKVVRLKEGEKLLLMNGEGLIAEAQVHEIRKRDLTVKVLKSILHPKNNFIELALAIPSKDAMEDVLRQAVELGITHIQPLLTSYSEKNFEFAERHQRIFESALIQSNNPYFPTVSKTQSFDDFCQKIDKQKTYLYFCSRSQSTQLQTTDTPMTLIIGPEGGFSLEEEEILQTRANVKFIHLPSYILRTPTAVSCACGLVFASHLK